MAIFPLYLLLASVSLPTLLSSSGVYASSCGINVCARYIRPYSDNAYSWHTVCGLDQPANSLIADNLEFYDSQYGWSVPARRVSVDEKLTDDIL